MRYDHKAVEKKWQSFWEKEKTFAAHDEARGERCYVLDMFPYPSAQGLHVGHPEGYTATDIYCRYIRMKGVNVLHPMGWDAFGLPTENYAIKIKRNPKEVAAENIDNFRRQVKSLGFSYDWSRELNTSDPSYYKWTQWLFLKFYEKGLAYRKEAPVIWCPSCQTVLANEQVVGGACERCHSMVEQKEMAQWFLKITDYAERLLKNLEGLDWPQAIIEMQKNWIGRSEGATIEFAIRNSQFAISIYTTRLDTIFGATYVVLAPEHELLIKLKPQITNWADVEKYIAKARRKTELERKVEEKEKTGVRLEGVMAINPANKERIPIFIADYVLASYGTGAIMAVPAHDKRDFEFAIKYELPIRQVIKPKNISKSVVVGTTVRDGLKEELHKKAISFEVGLSRNKREHIRIFLRDDQINDYIKIVQNYLNDNAWVEIIGYRNIFLSRDRVIDDFLSKGREIFEECKRLEPLVRDDKNIWEMLESNLFYQGFVCYEGAGMVVNSGEYDGLDSEEAKWKMVKKIGGNRTVHYKLRDWLISRQRYWGAPIPIIYCDPPAGGCGIMPVPEKDLPVLLPDDVDFRPTGESPLARSKSFHKVKCPKCGQLARRENDTMDTFVDSSWYFLRFADSHNDKEPFNKEKVKHWLPVNLYVGGAEHAVMHLLYVRFFTKVLVDLGYIDFQEPFLKLRNQGLILGEDGQKMSKSRGNVISPDEVVAVYGADTLRLYEMFMGPLEDAKPWNTQSIAGARRFLERVWHIVLEPTSDGATASTAEQEQELRYWSARTIKKVTEDIESFHFNTAISALMEFVNFLYGLREVETPLKDEARQTLLLLVYPFAPHITCELWQEAFPAAGYIWEEPWLEYDPEALQTDTVTIVIQVNGKLRGNIICQTGAGDEEINKLAKAEPNVAKWLEGKKIIKTIVKSGKLVNFVTN